MASKGRGSKRRKATKRLKEISGKDKDTSLVATGRDAVETGSGNGAGLFDQDFCYYCHDYGHFDGKCLDVYEDQAGGAQGEQASTSVASPDSTAPDPGTDSSSSLQGDQDWRHRRLAFLRDQWERAERIRGLACAFQKEIDQEEMWLRNNRYAPQPSYADGVKP